MKVDDLLARFDHVIALGEHALTKVYESAMGPNRIEGGAYHEFRSSALSLLRSIFSESHPFFREFNSKITANVPSAVRSGQGMLRAARTEVAAGWLAATKKLVAADIFSDFFEMAEHLLREGYKDPAAVIIGSVLEEHLRHLAENADIPVTLQRDDRTIPKKADTLNADLAKAAVYGTLDQKNVTAWLDLRNKAAHGRYGEYSQAQVELFAQAVANFIGR